MTDAPEQARPKAPTLIFFEGMGYMEGARKWSWRLVGYRCPRKGEHYLSGAEPQGYRAPNDLLTPYWVVEPLQPYALRQMWVPVQSKIGAAEG